MRFFRPLTLVLHATIQLLNCSACARLWCSLASAIFLQRLNNPRCLWLMDSALIWRVASTVRNVLEFYRSTSLRVENICEAAMTHKRHRFHQTISYHFQTFPVVICRKWNVLAAFLCQKWQWYRFKLMRICMIRVWLQKMANISKNTEREWGEEVEFVCISLFSLSRIRHFATDFLSIKNPSTCTHDMQSDTTDHAMRID